MGLEGAQVIGGVAIEIGADLSGLKAGYREAEGMLRVADSKWKIGVPVELKAGGQGLKVEVTRAVAAAGQGQIVSVGMRIDGPRLRADVGTAIAYAGSGQMLKIPVVLDTSAARAQLATLTASGGGGMMMLPGAGGASGGGGNGRKWVNSTVVGEGGGQMMITGPNARIGPDPSAGAAGGRFAGMFAGKGIETLFKAELARRIVGASSTMIAAEADQAGMAMAYGRGDLGTFEQLNGNQRNRIVGAIGAQQAIFGTSAGNMAIAAAGWGAGKISRRLGHWMPQTTAEMAASDADVAAGNDHAARLGIQASRARIVNEDAKSYADNVNAGLRIVGKSPTEAAVIEARRERADTEEKYRGRKGDDVRDAVKATRAQEAAAIAENNRAVGSELRAGYRERMQIVADGEATILRAGGQSLDAERVQLVAGLRAQLDVTREMIAEMKRVGADPQRIAAQEAKLVAQQQAGAAGLQVIDNAKIEAGYHHQSVIRGSNLRIAGEHEAAAIEGIEDKYRAPMEAARKSQNYEEFGRLNDTMYQEKTETRAGYTEKRLRERRATEDAELKGVAGARAGYSSRRQIARAEGSGEMALAGTLGRIGSMEQEYISAPKNLRADLLGAQRAELIGMQSAIMRPNRYATELMSGEAFGGPGGNAGHEQMELLKVIAEYLKSLDAKTRNSANDA